MDHSKGLNGYKPKSYGDLLAVATLIAMLMSTVAWGLKLENKIDAARDDNTELRVEIAKLRVEIAKGILPRADERIKALDIRIEHLEKDARP